MPARIFQDPPEAVDETWTHGAMLGGMVGDDDESLADSYFLAGDTLIDAVLDGKARSQDLIAPVLSAYRHGIELYLKAISEPVERNHHSLGSLLEGSVAFVWPITLLGKERSDKQAI